MNIGLHSYLDDLVLISDHFFNLTHRGNDSWPYCSKRFANEPEYVVVLYECRKGAQSRGFGFRTNPKYNVSKKVLILCSDDLCGFEKNPFIGFCFIILNYEVVQIFSLLRGKLHYNCSQNKDQRDEVEQHIFWEFYCCFHLPSKDFLHIQTSIYLLQIILLQGKKNFPLNFSFVGPTSLYQCQSHTRTLNI